jgi:DNA-binding SARP family transcriptional activator
VGRSNAAVRRGREYARAAAQMDINILGPIDVSDRDGGRIRLPAGRERSLLALLLINRDAVVSTDRIVEALWGSRPPDTAAKAVQGYVSHLRRVLEPGREPGDAHELLVTRPPGYALLAHDLAIDATRFERLAADGRRALEDGSPETATAVLTEALALWRGPALVEFAFEDFAQEEIRRLEQLRLAATEDSIEALLRLGRHAEVVARLESLVRANPLRERLRGQWMLALYRSDRQADALEAFREGRRLLAAELGLDPAPELQRLERAILAQDPALDAPATASPEPPIALSGSRSAGTATGRRRLILAGGLVAAVSAVAVFAIVRSTRDSPPNVVAPALVAIDASTNRIVASIPVGSTPTAVVASAHALWVGDAKDGTVTQIDPSTRRVVRTIGMGAPAIDLATGFGSVWVATGGFGTVVRIDEQSAQIADRIELGNPDDPIVPAVSSIGVGDGRVWAGAFDGLAVLDPATDTATDRIDLGQAPALQIAYADHALWTTLVTRRARRVETRPPRATTQFYEGTLSFALAFEPSAVWIAGVFGGQLWKIDPITGATLLTGHLSNGTVALALGAGSLWAASADDNSLERVDRATGAVRATIPIDGQPEDLVVRDGIVWVVVQHPTEPS